MEETKTSKTRELVIWWNNTFILDYWYRQKYKIPFNSKKHRNTEPISIMLEWEEEQLTTIIRNNQITEKQEKDYRNTGNWLNPRIEEVSEDFYDNLDWDSFK